GEAGNAIRPEDGRNFVILLQELRQELNRLESQGKGKFYISAAVAAATAKIAKYDIPGMASVCDWIFLMSYDYGGSWSANTQPITNVQGTAQDDFSTQAALDAWVNGGMPKNKILIGYVCYGRSY